MQPKKSLGQNFLKDKTILEKIIQAADLKLDDSVIEIGPGMGVLTEELLKYVGKIIAVEKDNNLAERLKEKYRNNEKIEIINDDILLFRHPMENYKVVANIPYYITSPIIQLFLETKYPPKVMILMVQKEVAERICEKPGNMSILSVSVQYYAKPELLFYVDKKSFWPVPKADSAVIKITPYDIIFNPSPYKREENKNNFFRLVKAGFCAKRKTLLNNLSNSLHLDRKIAKEKIKKVGLDPNRRAQELSVEDWKRLNECMKALETQLP